MPEEMSAAAARLKRDPSMLKAPRDARYLMLEDSRVMITIIG